MQKVVKDMSPIFDTINEFNAMETMLDLMLVLNKVMIKLDKIFTVQSIFGTSLFNIFELNLASNVFISTPQLLRTNVNFHRVGFLLGSRLGEKRTKKQKPNQIFFKGKPNKKKELSFLI
jgi:hypothetical protein